MALFVEGEKVLHTYTCSNGSWFLTPVLARYGKLITVLLAPRMSLSGDFRVPYPHLGNVLSSSCPLELACFFQIASSVFLALKVQVRP